MAGSVLNRTFRFLINISSKLKVNASKTATSPSCKTLERNFTSQIGFLLKSFVFKAMIKRGKIEDFAGQTFKEIFVWKFHFRSEYSHKVWRSYGKKIKKSSFYFFYNSFNQCFIAFQFLLFTSQSGVLQNKQKNKKHNMTSKTDLFL